MFVIAIIGFLLLIAGVVMLSRTRTRSVTVKFQTDAGTTVRSGHGSTVGAAVTDGIANMYYSLSESSGRDTVGVRLAAMKNALEENRKYMKRPQIEQCERFISRAQELFNRKEEAYRKLPAQRRFVQEQRRIMTDSLRYDVMRRDNFRCQLCGATQADGYMLHVDHIIPVSKGGKTEMNNLRTLCERCNMGKRDKIENPAAELTPEEFALSAK